MQIIYGQKWRSRLKWVRNIYFLMYIVIFVISLQQAPYPYGPSSLKLPSTGSPILDFFVQTLSFFTTLLPTTFLWTIWFFIPLLILHILVKKGEPSFVEKIIRKYSTKERKHFIEKGEKISLSLYVVTLLLVFIAPLYIIFVLVVKRKNPFIVFHCIQGLITSAMVFLVAPSFTLAAFFSRFLPTNISAILTIAIAGIFLVVWLVGIISGLFKVGKGGWKLPIIGRIAVLII